MSTLFSFPDWVPWWAQLLLLIVVILMGLAFLTMPFSVFGLKPRLEALEARLDEIQGEIRALSLRLPEPSRRAAYEDDAPVRMAPQGRPPIPPAAWQPDAAPRRPIGAPTRVEPRVDRR